MTKKKDWENFEGKTLKMAVMKKKKRLRKVKKRLKSPIKVKQVARLKKFQVKKKKR